MKPWYQSKTLWANVIVMVLALLSEVTKVFPPSENSKVWVLVPAVLNLILRFITDKGIEGSPISEA